MACEPAEHASGAAAHGVKAAPGPAHETQIGARQYRLEEGVAQARGRTKELRDLAGRGGDGLLGAPDLIRQGAWPEQRKAVQMALTVIFNGVAALHDLAGQGRVSGHPLADAEERGPGTVRLQKREHARGDLRVGSLVHGS